MTQSFFSILILIFTFNTYAQQVIPVYPGPVPQALDNRQLTDSTVTYGSGEDAFTFMVRVINPELTIYLPQKKNNTGIAVIICPGGGYTGLAINHEGHAIAKALQAEGIAGLVLKYRLPNRHLVSNPHTVPLQDAQRAIQLVRERAKQWNIDPQKVGILGNSAGGHLASTAGTHYNQALITNPLKVNLRPDFMILNYPVISFADSLTHLGSRMNLIGALPQSEIDVINADWQNSEKLFSSLPVPEDLIHQFSNELQVTAQTPRTFITHAVDDDVVKVQNTLLFIAALQKNHVPVESFFYARGGHGYGLDNPTSEVDWFDACLKWLKAGFGGK